MTTTYLLQFKLCVILADNTRNESPKVPIVQRESKIREKNTGKGRQTLLTYPINSNTVAERLRIHHIFNFIYKILYYIRINSIDKIYLKKKCKKNNFENM